MTVPAYYGTEYSNVLQQIMPVNLTSISSQIGTRPINYYCINHSTYTYN